MNHKAVLLVALLAVCLAPAICLCAPDSSADGGEIRGEGSGDGIRVTYEFDTYPLVNVILDNAPAEEMYFSIAGNGYVDTIGLLPKEKDILIVIEEKLTVGEYSILMTTVSGSHVADCIMKVQVYQKVSFDANGGSGSMEDELVPSGSYYTLPACGFKAPSGERFAYWTVGSGQYQPEEAVMVTSSVKAVACWEEIPSDDNIMLYAAAGAALVLIISIAVVLVLRRRTGP
jgi:hypothetical protein